MLITVKTVCVGTSKGAGGTVEKSLYLPFNFAVNLKWLF